MRYEFDIAGTLKAPSQKELEAADQNSHIIVCNYGTTDDDEPYWVYIAVKPSKYMELIQLAQEQEYIFFEDYGTILRYGIGQEIPADIKKEMEQEYGCDDNYMKKLTDDVQKQQMNFLETQEDMRINDIVRMLKNKTDN